jgi:hypothetical protein
VYQLKISSRHAAIQKAVLPGTVMAFVIINLKIFPSDVKGMLIGQILNSPECQRSDWEIMRLFSVFQVVVRILVP